MDSDSNTSSEDDYNFWTSSETGTEDDTEETEEDEVEGETETEEDIDVEDETDEDVEVETEEEVEIDTEDILEDETDEEVDEPETEAEADDNEKCNNIKVDWNCTPAKQASLLTTAPPKVIKAVRISRPSTNKTVTETPEKVKSPVRDTEVDHNGNSIPKPNELRNITSALETKRKKRKKYRPITICLAHCRYEIVKSVASSFGLKSVGEAENWNIYWTDFSVSLDRAMDLKRFQVVNHFPGMNEICRKDLLARNLNRMKKLFHKDYDIFPRTWSLPADLGDLQMYHATHRNKTYICKPEMGCQGRGIFLVRNIRDLNPFGKIICQLYIQKPFLIDDLKFDLRIYILMTSCDPLRIYFYNEGLARFATAKYKLPTNHNTENSYMHLTNYAVNKYSRDFVPDDAINGSKRKYTAVLEWFKERKYDTHAIEAQIEDVIIKTIITAQPILKHNYKTCFPNHDICCACFEILGFDIILDMNLKPYVLEVNHSPSFHTDSQIDREIKENLLKDTFAMFNLKLLDRRKIVGEDRKRVIQRLVPNDKKDADVESSRSVPERKERKSKANWELEAAGGYRLIYPSETSHVYDKFFDQNLGSIYQGTAASQARVNLIRNQIEEYNLKKQEEDKKRSVSTSSVINRVKDLSTSKEIIFAEKEIIKPRSNKWPLHTNANGDSFKVQHIIAEEELDRLKGLMQRGIMIRSMGVEVHVYKLLSDMGCIKPKDEKLFRRLHGFTNHFKTKSHTDIRLSSVQNPAPNKPLIMGPVPTPELCSGLCSTVQSQLTSQSQSPRTNVTTSSANSTVEDQLGREDVKRAGFDSYNIALHYTSSDINGNYGSNTYRYNPYGPRAANIFPDSKYSGPAIKNLSLGGSDPSYKSLSFPSQVKVPQHRPPQQNASFMYTNSESFSSLPNKRIISEVHRSFENRRAQLTTECYNSGYAINVATNRVMPSGVASDANSTDRFNTFGSGDQLEPKRLGMNFARQCGLQQRLPNTAAYSATQWTADTNRGYYYQNNNTPAAFQNNNSISSLRAPYLAAEARQNLNNAYGDDEFGYIKRSPRENIQSGRLSGRSIDEKTASVSGIEDAGIVLPRRNKSKRSSVIQSQRTQKLPDSSELQGPMRVTQMFFDSKGLAQPRKPLTARGGVGHAKTARAAYNLMSAEIIPGRNLKAEIQTAKSSIPLIMPHTGRRIIAPRSEKIIYTNNTEDNLRMLQKGHASHTISSF